MGGPVGPVHLASRHARARRRLAALRRLPVLRLPPDLTFAVAVVGPAVLAAGLSSAAPTGLRVLDEAYVGLLAAVVAYFAASARRWTWFLPAGCGAVVAADWRAALPAAVAIALGFWTVATDRRTPVRAALVAGLGMAALLRADPVGFHGATALITAGAVTPVLVSGYRLAGRRVRRRARRALLLAGGLVGLMLIGAAVGGLTVARDLIDGAKLLDQGIVAARDADDDAAAQRLGEAALHLQAANSTLESWFVRPARGLPFVGPNLRAVSRLAEDTSSVAEVTSDAATAVDVDTLRFTDGRIDPELVGMVADNLAAVASSLGRAQAAVDAVQSPWLVDPVRERMEELRQQVDENGPDVESAAEGARVAYSLLGVDAPQRYLVLFTTPVETRGRTGFPGNYAELVVEDGRITMPRFGRISELEQGGTPGDQRALVHAPLDFLTRYGRFDPAATWRNVVMSPDFPTIVQVAAELYPQSGGSPLTGVMSIDPTGLAALMEFTGNIDPAEVPLLTEPLTPENTAEFLHRRQYELYPEETDDRVDLLEDVAEITFRRLTTEIEMPTPEAMVDVLDPVVDGGHIQFSAGFHVDYFDSIGLAGRFDPLLGDFLSVVSSNAGGSKIDLFLERRLEYEVVWDPTTGSVGAKVTATLHNAAPASGLPDYIIGNDVGLPWGTNRSFVSIYNSFYGLEAARINGQPVALQAEQELGRDVYSTFVDIPPGGTVTIELDLVGAGNDTLYPLTLAQQPLVNPEQAEVAITVGGDEPIEVEGDGATIDGRTVRWSGPLDRERTFAVTYGRGGGDAPPD